MPTPLLSDDEAAEAVALFRRLGNKTAAAKELGIAPSTFRHRLKIAARRGLDLSTPPHGYEVAAVTVTERDGEEKGRSTRYVPEREAYQVREGHEIRAESALLDADGRLIQRWIKTREEADRETAFLDAVKATLDAYAPLAPITPPAAVDSDLLTVYPIPDAHVGLRSHPPETAEDYNLHVASQVIRETTQHLVGSTPASETAVVLFLGDYFHADDQTQQTPGGKHQLDMDGRISKVLHAGVDLALSIVSACAARHKRTIVRALPGNHDPSLSAALGMALWAAFRKHERIEVDISPGLFWWFEWGRCLLGATHGHTIKQQAMPLTMAAAVPEAWGRTCYRLFLSGHIHHQRSIETGGVICRSFPTLAARDAYAASLGLMSHRGMVALTLHRDDGPCGEIARYLPLARYEAAA